MLLELVRLLAGFFMAMARRLLKFVAQVLSTRPIGNTQKSSSQNREFMVSIELEIFGIVTESCSAEETLHTLLYENRNNPDQELMKATSRSGVSYTSDEEDTERSGGLARLRSNKQNNPT